MYIPPFMDEVLSEEKVKKEINETGGNIPGGNFLGGNFSVEISQGGV